MARRPSFFIIGVLLCLALTLGGAVYAGDRFTDNGDGTITDHELGLMWAKSDNQGDISWKEARQWIEFTFPYSIPTNYDNWRMPTLDELASLYMGKDKQDGYETACGQWVWITPRIRLSCGWVWSSETSAIQAFIYNFNRGYHYSDRMVHKKAYRALAVRNID